MQPQHAEAVRKQVQTVPNGRNSTLWWCTVVFACPGGAQDHRFLLLDFIGILAGRALAGRPYSLKLGNYSPEQCRYKSNTSRQTQQAFVHPLHAVYCALGAWEGHGRPPFTFTLIGVPAWDSSRLRQWSNGHSQIEVAE